MAEYRRLKAEVEKRSTIISGNLDHKMQEQAASKSSIEVCLATYRCMDSSNLQLNTYSMIKIAWRLAPRR